MKYEVSSFNNITVETGCSKILGLVNERQLLCNNIYIVAILSLFVRFWKLPLSLWIHIIFIAVLGLLGELICIYTKKPKK